jgi:inositol phosphorylceramide mannosyltransferase catalytic subunit
MARRYPWFLETYDGYVYPIQRADAIRYFVLAHFGGVYIDMDDGCNRSLEPLLAYPAWLRRTLPTGISNDAMGSIPRHPFFLRTIDSLPEYNRNWPLPYLTVMASTGPLFLSLIWIHHRNTKPVGNDVVRILFPDEYNNHAWSFFLHNLGNSWHSTDVQLIFWMAKHWILLTVVGFILGFAIIFGSFWLYRKIVPSAKHQKHRSPILRYRILSLFRTVTGRPDIKDYELVERHERHPV